MSVDKPWIALILVSWLLARFKNMRVVVVPTTSSTVRKRKEDLNKPGVSPVHLSLPPVCVSVVILLVVEAMHECKYAIDCIDS